MYDKPQTELALDKSRAVVIFIIFVVLFIIKKVLPPMYSRQMYIQNVMRFLPRKTSTLIYI